MTNLDNEEFFDAINPGEDLTILSDGTVRTLTPGPYSFRSSNEPNPQYTTLRAGTYRIHAAISWSDESHTRQCTDLREVISNTLILLNTTTGEVTVDDEVIMHVGGAGQAGYRTLVIDEIPRRPVTLISTPIPEDQVLIPREDLEAFQRFQEIQRVERAARPSPQRDERQIDLR